MFFIYMSQIQKRPYNKNVVGANIIYAVPPYLSLRHLLKVLSNPER